MTLAKKLKKLAEFDERTVWREIVLTGPDDGFRKTLWFTRAENARLQPLITALIECVEVMKRADENWSFTQLNAMGPALARLSALCDGKDE